MDGWTQSLDGICIQHVPILYVTECPNCDAGDARAPFRLGRIFIATPSDPSPLQAPLPAPERRAFGSSVGVRVLGVHPALPPASGLMLMHSSIEPTVGVCLPAVRTSKGFADFKKSEIFFFSIPWSPKDGDWPHDSVTPRSISGGFDLSVLEAYSPLQNVGSAGHDKNATSARCVK